MLLRCRNISAPIVAPDFFRIESSTFFSDPLHRLAEPQPPLVQTRGNVARHHNPQLPRALRILTAARPVDRQIPHRAAVVMSHVGLDPRCREVGFSVRIFDEAWAQHTGHSVLGCQWRPGRATYNCTVTRSQGVLRRVQPRARRAEGLVRHPSHCRMSRSQSRCGTRASPNWQRLSASGRVTVRVRVRVTVARTRMNCRPTDTELY
jgi:hypothetical protein